MTLVEALFPNLQTPKSVDRSMSKKPRLRGTFEKQHGKWVQTLLKSERKDLYQISW